MEKRYYGILMDKVEIQENIALYIPERIIPGYYSETVGTDGMDKIFIEESYGKDYLLMDDVMSIFPPNDKVVGYIISEEDLLKETENSDVEQSKIQYFDQICETVKIGIYIPEKFSDRIIFFNLNLEGLKIELTESEVDETGEITTSYYDIISSLIDINSFCNLVNVKDDDKKVIFEPIDIDEDEKNESIEEVKNLILDKYKKQKEEETLGKLIIELEKLSPKEINKSNDIPEIKEKLSSAILICDKIIRKVEESKCDKLSEVQEKTVKKPSIEKVEEKEFTSDKPFSIKRVKEICDKRIIGQEAAKEAVISTIYMNKKDGNHLNKNTCLLVGPTGSGKTLIVETVADILDIPAVSVDTTQLTIAGYKGADIETYLATLISKAGGDVKKAEQGIIIFDEFDKKGSDNNSDVSGKGVLNSLLPFIQGTLYKVNMGKGIGEKTIDFSTNNLTVLIAGSCTDAIKAVEKERNKVLGFQSNSKDNKDSSEFYRLTKEDIEKYCNIPEEFMGRISNVVQLQPHTKETIRQIILESDISPLLSEKEKLNQDGIELSWNDKYIDKLGEKVLEDSHGVRALKEIIETSIMPARWKVLYEEDLFKEIILNEKSIDEPLETVLVYKDGNYTTVRELKTNLDNVKVKEKSNDIK